MTTNLDIIKAAKKPRVWFWKPQWHWFGPRTLSPILPGHDEFGRRCVVLGWSVTGRVIIALWYCGSEDCYAYSAENMEYLLDDGSDEALD